MGRRGMGFGVMFAGVATMAIGATLAVVEFGQMYQRVAADPLGSTETAGAQDDEESEAVPAKMLRHVTIAALGAPFAVVGSVMVRRERKRSANRIA